MFLYLTQIQSFRWVINIKLLLKTEVNIIPSKILPSVECINSTSNKYKHKMNYIQHETHQNNICNNMVYIK